MILENIQCPFCKEKGFDLIGLKHHLFNNCEVFDKTMSVWQERRKTKEKNEQIS